MVRLDSIKLLVKNDVINSYGNQFLDTRTNNGDGILLSDKSSLNKTGLNGFKNVIIDKRNDTASFEFSAKILGSDYFEGINQNTIQKAIENINKTGLIDLNVNKFLDTAEILRVDITDNIKPEINGEIFYKTLASLPIAKKYHTDLFNTKSNLGVVYKGTQKTVRDRIIFYDKTMDLIRDKSLRQSPYANQLFKQFQNVVRVESNHSEFKGIRKHLGTRNLLDALKTDIKPNYDVFTRITDKTNDIDLRLFSQFEGMKFNAIRAYLGDKGIIELCNNDWQQIELFIRVHNKNNYRHYKKTIKSVYNTLNQETKTIDLNIINHIKQLLNVA